jgi:hypothetical protein
MCTNYEAPHYAVFSSLPPLEALKVKGIFVPVIFSFNSAPCHEGVLGEWRYSSTHSACGQLHVLAALPPREEPLVPIG